MKERSKRKTSLKSSILILLLLAVFLITSSYAWFTSNQTVTVSSLQVNVQAQNGLQVSVDGTNWKTVISNDDIKGAIATYSSAVNQISPQLEPVSTAGTTTDGFLDMFYGKVGPDESGNYRLNSEKATEANGETGKFIAFDLFVKVDANTPVYITNNSGVKTPELETDKGIKNASRMAFLNQGTLPAGSALSAIQGLDGVTPATTHIWEPNYDVHTAAGVAYAKDTYGIDTTLTGAAALDYSGLKSVITEENAVLLDKATATDNSDYFGNVNVTHRTTQAFPSNIDFITLETGITKLRVYMWVEGQDVDCENTASGTNITFDLQLSVNEA